MKKQEHVEILLVGGGPACVSAAVQLSRCKREILVVSPEVGGNVRYARNLENLAGFPSGISGAAFAERLRQQVDAFQIPMRVERVTGLKRHEGLFRIQTEKSFITGNTVIIGSGTQPNNLGIPGEDEARAGGRIASHPDELDFPTTKRVVVAGGGDVACESALTLAEKGIEVHMLVRGTRLRALERLQEPVFAAAGISVNVSCPLRTIHCTEDEIIVRTGNVNRQKEWAADALLVAVGRMANLDFLAPELHPGNNHLVDGFFLVGDAAHPHHRQVAMAVGDGMRAAMEITTPIQREPNEF